MDYFYRNAQAYETWWVHEGTGTLKTQFGNLEFHAGDYIVIPFGTTWQMMLATPEARFFTIENPSQLEPPKRYRNDFGQMLEHAPYSERDIRVPQSLETHTERGTFDVRIKVRDRLTRHVLDHHPFDVVGLGWVSLSVDLQYRRFRAHHRPGASAAAGAPVLPGAQLRGVFVRAAACSTTTRRPSRRHTTIPTSIRTR